MLKAGSKIVAKLFYSAIVDEGFLETDLHNSKHRPTNAVVHHEHDASGISQCLALAVTLFPTSERPVFFNPVLAAIHRMPYSALTDYTRITTCFFVR
jgi:hypothetical protein